MSLKGEQFCMRVIPILSIFRVTYYLQNIHYTSHLQIVQKAVFIWPFSVNLLVLNSFVYLDYIVFSKICIVSSI